MFEFIPEKSALSGKTILVTGAGSGIGKAAALAYAEHGASVILLGKQVAKLEAVYDQIEANGGPQPAIFDLDLETASDNEYMALASGIESEFGNLDGLLLNAGILGSKVPLQSYSLNTWNQVMQINLNANFALSKYLLPLLQEAEQASIIFTSSSVGRHARAYWGAYSVSKCAIEALAQVLFQELEQTSKIRVNTINPGACSTAMRKKAFPGEDPQTLKQPEQLMAAFLYLMCEESIAINGEQLDAQ